MPAPAQQPLRKDMVDHLLVLNQLLGQLASGDFVQASDLAESSFRASAIKANFGWLGLAVFRWKHPFEGGLLVGRARYLPPMIS
jgi:hypothetical protein